MKIVYVQTYPIYHDGIGDESWKSLENRDKWMPALTASLGHETELWCLGKKAQTYSYSWSSTASVLIRIFPADSTKGRSKTHKSSAMAAFAPSARADLFFLKGTDGGAGLHLLRRYLLPANLPFVFVVGGKFTSRYNSRAAAVLCETEEQKHSLLSEAPWYKKPFAPAAPSKVFILPKSVDTERFRPYPEMEKQWDVISMGRLIPYYKDYSSLKDLSQNLRVAHIGGGASLPGLRKQMPRIEWLGHVPHHEIPACLSKARCLFHTSLKDYFPRVIPEAAACGLPVVAFKSAIKPDVLPSHIGLGIDGATDVSGQIADWLAHDLKVEQAGENARKHAVQKWAKDSALPVIRELLQTL